MEKRGQRTAPRGDGLWSWGRRRGLRVPGLQPLVPVRNEGHQLPLQLSRDLPTALAGGTGHKAGTSSPFTRHTGTSLAAMGAGVGGSLAANG